MSAVRLSTRWAGVVARLGALVIAIAAALLVVLLAACQRVPAPGAAPSPRAITSLHVQESHGVVESPALAAAESLATRLTLARLAATAGAAGVAHARDVVTAEQWRDGFAGRIEELIAGRVAGVQVVRTTDGLSIRVRGPATLLGGGEPLVVLDGQPLAQGARELLLINPADVARIEVLKDAGSTALYGVRGTNGVLLVTTRRPGR